MPAVASSSGQQESSGACRIITPISRSNDTGTDIHYHARRRQSPLEFGASARIGPQLTAAGPESFEYFSCERYQFYAEHRGKLRRSRVHHTPYVLHAVEAAAVDTTLLTAAGLPSDGARVPDLFSPGVDVEVFSTEDV
jgi:uncharacterized protein YqjF (DUF2071 family)